MYKKLMQDMDKATLLKMRDEEGMTYEEMSLALGCSKTTLYKILGPMTPEQRAARKSMGGKRSSANRWSNSSKEVRTVDRKLMSFKPQREEPEPVKAVLTVKRRDIQLAGAYMHYTVSASGGCVDVETDQGNVLISVPNDKLDAFIEELTAIRHHIGDVKPMEFWG